MRKYPKIILELISGFHKFFLFIVLDCFNYLPPPFAFLTKSTFYYFNGLKLKDEY